jgi:hypothetical protein
MASTVFFVASLNWSFGLTGALAGVATFRAYRKHREGKHDEAAEVWEMFIFYTIAMWSHASSLAP